MCEILAPAGNEECALAAINAGADAVYLGYSAFSARANAGNFDENALALVIKRAHFLNVKVYVAMNTLVKDSETEAFIKTLLSVWRAGADAIIMQDLLLGRAIHRQYPEIVLHLSTQAGVCDVYGAKLAKEYGFSRVILARETPLEEIEKIAKIIETEVFVQGALCTSFSGQCYFSSFAGGNSGNRGRCKQPCRKRYTINREGHTDYSYALSLSDLCAGESVERFIKAGVASFKIEGRMRRAEYVAAAVSYYRLLLSANGGTESTRAQALSDLKRTYNRGNYTKGLAFGQDKRFLSRSVQGHIGEKVGVVKVLGGKYYVESGFSARQGDAFKLLRGGAEVGGATFERSEKRGFYITSKTRLLNGDGVFVTTDGATNERVLSVEKHLPISLSLRFAENERAFAQIGELVVQSEDVLTAAQSAPLSFGDVKSCFLKTDALPIEVEFKNIEIVGNVFFAKSRLNAFRRAVYESLFNAYTSVNRTEYTFDPSAFFVPISETSQKGKTAVISSDFSSLQNIDVAIYKPKDYTMPPEESFLKGDFQKYLYVPAYFTKSDCEAIEKTVEKYALCGIYAENYAGIFWAREKGFKLFAATGFNLTNKIAVGELLKTENVDYFALSKELDEREQNALYKLSPEKAAALVLGDIKLMELCYCPFGASCATCDKKELYTLTDENGRSFSLRRYKGTSGNCRFEVYNCAELVSANVFGGIHLIDFSAFLLSRPQAGNAVLKAIENEEEQKAIFQNYTSGHRKNSVL